MEEFVTKTGYDLLKLLAVAAAAFLVSLILFGTFKLIIKRFIESSSQLVGRKFKVAFVTLFVVVSLNVALGFTNFPATATYYIHKTLYLSLVFSIALLLAKTTEFLRSVLYERFDINEKDNLDERKARTQIDFLQKLSVVFIFLIAASIALMSFEKVRSLGTSILASAGIAGLIIGIAAQKSLANLLAGLQIAFTQPIRLDDVVIVENEFGNVEEITLTYVVVKIWDERRMILPISYFIEKPFQNWTRKTSDLLGMVYIYADYSLPVDALRAELTRVLQEEAQGLWDGKVNGIQVTDANEKTIQLRALVSATSASKAWDLRCLVREKLIGYIQKNYPESLPQIRILDNVK